MMKYTDLTLSQRIGLKSEFVNNPACHSYLAIWRFFNFVLAVEYFLNDDIGPLLKHI